MMFICKHIIKDKDTVMIAPQAYKLKCPKCGYSKTVKPKSDVLNPTDMLKVCPKCKVAMKREELSGLSKLFGNLFSLSK